MKALYLMAATALSAAAITGCKSTSQIVTNEVGQIETVTATETANIVQHVIYGKWIATTVGNTTVTGDNRPYIVFEKENANPYIVKYYANNGCNTINGTMAVTKGGKMEAASEAAATMMLCPDAPYEMGVTMALNTVRSYTVTQSGSDYILSMKNATGNTTMTLQKVNENVLNGVWTVTSLGTESIDESIGMQMVIDIKEQKVHGNAGCNVFNGKITENSPNGSNITISDVRTTRMTCPNIALENRFLNALQQTVNVRSSDNNNTVQLLSSDNTPLVTLVRQ